MDFALDLQVAIMDTTFLLPQKHVQHALTQIVHFALTDLPQVYMQELQVFASFVNLDFVQI